MSSYAAEQATSSIIVAAPSDQAPEPADTEDALNELDSSFDAEQEQKIAALVAEQVAAELQKYEQVPPVAGRPVRRFKKRGYWTDRFWTPGRQALATFVAGILVTASCVGVAHGMRSDDVHPVAPPIQPTQPVAPSAAPVHVPTAQTSVLVTTQPASEQRTQEPPATAQTQVAPDAGADDDASDSSSESSADSGGAAVPRPRAVRARKPASVAAPARTRARTCAANLEPEPVPAAEPAPAQAPGRMARIRNGIAWVGTRAWNKFKEYGG